jgi:hypothetical protein
MTFGNSPPRIGHGGEFQRGHGAASFGRRVLEAVDDSDKVAAGEYLVSRIVVLGRGRGGKVAKQGGKRLVYISSHLDKHCGIVLHRCQASGRVDKPKNNLGPSLQQCNKTWFSRLCEVGKYYIISERTYTCSILTYRYISQYIGFETQHIATKSGISLHITI